MSAGVFIDRWSFHLGPETSTVEEAARVGRTRSDPAVLREAGFDVHHHCPDGVDAYQLARDAVRAIVPELGDIGAIVYATCIPTNGNLGSWSDFERTRDVKHLMEFPASRLQADFGLERATVIGLNQQACTGMLGALRVARMLLLSEPEIGRVLCVTADRFPPGALYEQAYNLVSDGAAACIASHEAGGFRLVATHAVTNGAMALASDDETAGSYFGYVHRIIQETLAKAGLTLADVHWIVPQNTHAKAWQILARLLPFDPERVCFGSMAEVGHVISADNVINLMRLDAEGRIRPGERILLLMAGYGLNWQCVILEKV